MSARFRGDVNGVAIDWDAAAPLSGERAEHVQPQKPGDPAILRIAETISGRDQLGAACFELINLESGAELAMVWGEAVPRTRTKRDFAEAMSKLEYRAVIKFQVVARQFELVPGPDDLLLCGLLDASMNSQ